MIKLDNSAICTCDTEGGCAHHGMGEAGVYRKSFEHASENYTTEKSRADQLEHSLEIWKEKYNKLAHHIYHTFPQHKDEGPWGTVACAAKDVERAQARHKSAEADTECFIKENTSLKEQILELRAALRALASLVTESELKARSR